jgi:hypothetical protein
LIEGVLFVTSLAVVVLKLINLEAATWRSLLRVSTEFVTQNDALQHARAVSVQTHNGRLGNPFARKSEHCP